MSVPTVDGARRTSPRVTDRAGSPLSSTGSSSERDLEPPRSTPAGLHPGLALPAGAAVGILVSTVIFGAWTVTAFLIPWVAVAGFVLSWLLDPLVLRGGRAGWLGAPWGAVFGLVCVGVLLVIEPMAGMAGPLLPVLAIVLGSIIGGCATMIGPRIASRRGAVALVALAVFAASIVAVLGRP